MLKFSKDIYALFFEKKKKEFLEKGKISNVESWSI